MWVGITRERGCDRRVAPFGARPGAGARNEAAALLRTLLSCQPLSPSGDGKSQAHPEAAPTSTPSLRAEWPSLRWHRSAEPGISLLMSFVY